MPRRWDNNSGGGGGSLKHSFVGSTPARMTGENGPVDLRAVEIILMRNAKIASKEKVPSQRFLGNNSR